MFKMASRVLWCWWEIISYLLADRQKPRLSQAFLQLSGSCVTTATTIISLSLLTSAASPAVLSVFCSGPLETESWCCGMEERPHWSALCLLRGPCCLAPSFSTLLYGSETKPGFKKKREDTIQFKSLITILISLYSLTLHISADLCLNFSSIFITPIWRIWFLISFKKALQHSHKLVCSWLSGGVWMCHTSSVISHSPLQSQKLCHPYSWEHIVKYLYLNRMKVTAYNNI